MKKIILMIVLSIGLNNIYAQKIKIGDVPIEVKNGFKTHFPNAKVESWVKEGKNYEAEFDVKKVETSALLDADGKLLETESEIAVSELPKTAIEYLAKLFKGEKIKEVAKIVEANGKVKYEAEVMGKDILFDENGSPI